MTKIKFTINKDVFVGELRNTPTAKKLLEALDYQSGLTRWGDEIYFPALIKTELEKDAKQVVSIGDICFWLGGASLCIFFGPTPISENDECKAYEKLNLVGKIVKGDLKRLKAAKTGDKDRVEKIA